MSEQEYRFDRYVNGRLKAEGAKVHASSEKEALEKARKLFYPLWDGETFKLRSVAPET